MELVILVVLGLAFYLILYSFIFLRKKRPTAFIFVLISYLIDSFIKLFTGILEDGKLVMVGFPTLWNNLNYVIKNEATQDYIQTYYVVNAHHDYQKGQYVIVGSLSGIEQSIYGYLIFLWWLATFIVFPILSFWLKKKYSRRRKEVAG